ncbi:MAG: FG-GAP-like repeat-containing protein, partial [Candidatus Altiarchaeota archaeon]
MKITSISSGLVLIVLMGFFVSAEGDFEIGCAMDLSNDYASSLVIDDLDGNGVLDVLAGTVESGQLHRLVYKDADCLVSWQPAWSYLARGDIRSIDIADVDGDTKKEVVINGGITKSGEGKSDAYVFVLKSDGLKLWKEDQIGGYTFSVSAGNLDADRQLEIVAGAKNNKVVVYNEKSDLLWEFATENPVYFVKATDVDGDGVDEVVALSYKYGMATVYLLSKTGSQVWVHKIQDGIFTGGVEDPIAVADIDRDGKKEIVVGSMKHGVDVIDDKGGIKWNYPLGGLVSSVEILDLEDDGAAEIIVGAKPDLVILDGQGNALGENSAISHTINSITSADVDGDGIKEVVAGTTEEVLVFDGEGELIGSWMYSS